MWLSATARRLVSHRFRRYREEAEVHGNRQGMGGTQIVLESHEQGQRDGTGRPSGKGRRGGTIPLQTQTQRVGNLHVKYVSIVSGLGPDTIVSHRIWRSPLYPGSYLLDRYTYLCIPGDTTTHEGVNFKL